VPRKRWREIRDLARAELASPVTSSAGRLFDGVAALCGIRPFVNYEGQAAIELEAACDPAELEHYDIALRQRHGRLVLDVRPAIGAVACDLARGTAVGAVAARFHNTIAAAVADSCSVVARRHRTRTVVLSGGVFQNRRLLEDAAQRLNAAGLRTLVPERLPVNDGGISYGQAVVAAVRLARRDADGRS
jgi:hydrogenase maturation protein HypF